MKKYLNDILNKHSSKKELEQDEYLFKQYNNTGYLTKLNKDGSVPIKFLEWNSTNRYIARPELKIQLRKEVFREGWKIEGSRYGESQNWAILKHPDGFTVEIYMNNLINLLKEIEVKNGTLIGEFKWEYSKLIKK